MISNSSNLSRCGVLGPGPSAWIAQKWIIYLFRWSLRVETSRFGEDQHYLQGRWPWKCLTNNHWDNGVQDLRYVYIVYHYGLKQELLTFYRFWYWLPWAPRRLWPYALKSHLEVVRKNMRGILLLIHTNITQRSKSKKRAKNMCKCYSYYCSE